MAYLYPTKDANPNLAFAVMGEIESILVEQMPELKADFAPTGTCVMYTFADETIFLAKFKFGGRGATSVGLMNEDEAESIKKTAGEARRFKDVSKITEMRQYFGWDAVLFLVDVDDHHLDFGLIQEDIVDWLNDKCIARAEKINRARILRAIPTPPKYSLEIVGQAMWVLECDERCVQGTAFDLSGVGTLTNAHVIEGATAMKAFRANSFGEKYDVRVVKRNIALDLAIIDVVGGKALSPLVPAFNNSMETMQHVAVCGFPNYRIGDSGILSPGIVVGTRQRSGIRRLLTNAIIVAGMSGGPAIGRNNSVVGVCVTGAQFIQGTRDTEDQSIIPIDAVRLL